MSRPALFSSLSLEKARAEVGDRLLLIDFTAAWCGPCKHMDATTWVDAAVVKWVGEHALALQLDVDTDSEAKAFDIKAMPTIVAIKAGAELDRIVGARNSHHLIAWLDGLLQGKTSLAAAREAASGNDLMARFELAQQLLMTGRADEGLEQIEWVWRNSLAIEPAWVGVRHSFLINLMQRAVEGSPKGREKIAVLRDASETGTDDWISLNEALGEPDRTMAWFDALDAPKRRELKGKHALKVLLRARDRWKELGELIADPLEDLASTFEGVEELTKRVGVMPAELVEQLKEHMTQSARTTAADLVRALRAAGRDSEADQVKAEALRRDASEAMVKALS